MIFRELGKDEFIKFLDSSDQATFFQDPRMELYSDKTNRTSYYVGVLENDKVVAATRMTSIKGFLGLRSFYAPRGFLIDYKNFKLLKFFVDNLKRYLKEKKCYRLHIDPYVIYKSRDIDGKITEDIDNTEIVENLKKLGFSHDGFTTGYDYTKQVRWQYVLDIKDKTEEDILKGIKANHKNLIRKAEKYGVEIKEIGYDDLETYKMITEDTSDRIGFQDRSLVYYQTMYESFKDDVKFIIAYLNVEKYQTCLKQELNENNLRYEKLNDKSTGKAKELKITIDGIEKRLKESNKFTEKMIPISAAMFMLDRKEIDYLFSGSIDKYKNLYAQYLIQWYIIKYACKKGYKRYNFFGISGIFDKKDRDYGVYEFKKGFGGHVEELIGDFYLSTSLLYKIYKILRRSN